MLSRSQTSLCVRLLLARLLGRAGGGREGTWFVELEVGNSATSGRHRGLCALSNPTPISLAETQEFLRSPRGVS